jgi:tripartite-type tricarboxylate transporter receptor subunit TctC
MKKFIAALIMLPIVAASSFAAGPADNFPNKPIHMIVPYPPGGGFDVVARLIGNKLAERLKQTVIIENRAGANGNIGAMAVAKSAPDGYTLMMGGIGPNAINPSIYNDSGFDPIKDFAPVMLVATFQNILAVNPALPVKNVKELIAYAKANPGKLSFASAGSGSTQHVSGELFKTMAGINMLHVPYKGSAPALLSTLSNETSMIFNSTPTTLPHVKGGKLRALAVTGSKRSAEAPTVPTVAESGVPKYEVLGWYGVVAPAGTPKDIVNKLNAELVAVTSIPEIRARFQVLGIESASGTPKQFEDYIKTEVVKWAKVVKESGAKAD